MPFSIEGFATTSAARNGLAAGIMVPMPSSGIQITGTNYITPSARARILREVAVLTDTIARFDEAAIKASHDPNQVRIGTASDQTGLHGPFTIRCNYPLIDSAGNTSIFTAYESNAALGAEIAYLFAVLCSDDHPGITTMMPSLPSNARPVTFTVAITSIAGQWVAGTPAYSMTFQPGRKYAIFGGGVSSKGANTLNAWRIVPKAGSDPADLFPGALCGDSQLVLETWYSKDGQPWMVFDGLTPPDIAINGMTAAAQAPFGHLIIAEV